MGAWTAGPGVVRLWDDRCVRGRALRLGVPDGELPELGVYLLGEEPPPTDWPQRWIRWPDFRTPSDTDDALDVLREAHARAATERVEVACLGGRGRTGTALAALAVLSGVDPKVAVAWVRVHYDHHAVETPWQRRWVRRLPAVERPEPVDPRHRLGQSTPRQPHTRTGPASGPAEPHAGVGCRESSTGATRHGAGSAGHERHAAA